MPKIDTKKRTRAIQYSAVSNQDEIVSVPIQQNGSLQDAPNGTSTPENQKNENREDQTTKKAISKFRSILPQILSVTAKNLVLLDLGMTLAFPTIVVPVLLDKRAVDSKGLSFDESQASWFASIAMICQPIGSAMSGMLSAPLGRKRSLMLVNIPQIIGWLLLYFASSVEVMYAATVIQGIGAGFMDAPVVTYIGEICEPSLRGILMSYTLNFYSFGFFLQCLLGSLFQWRDVALISIIFPSLAFISISQIPETPMWLMSKNRFEEAEKALCWLRGWVSKEVVAEEFANLKKYSNNSKYSGKTSASSVVTDGELMGKEPTEVDSCPDPQIGSPSFGRDDAYNQLTIFEKIKDLLRPEIIRPMVVVTILNALTLTTGLHGFKSYMVLVFQRLHVPLDANWASVWISTALILSHVSQILVVKFVGKRLLTLISTFGSAFLCFAVAIQINFQSLFKDLLGETSAGWILFGYFVCLSYIVQIGLGPIPWMLMSEIFPFRGRSLATGVCASIYYAMSFLASKTYLSLLALIGVGGSHYLYGFITAMGFVYIYLYLPETEGLTLEEIEAIYSRKERAEESLKKCTSFAGTNSGQKISDDRGRSPE